MRPIADTAVASMVNMPALDSKSCPQCTMCQSVAQPSTAEYWHIGETTIRLASASLRSLKGENRVLDMAMARFQLEENGMPPCLVSTGGDESDDTHLVPLLRAQRARARARPGARPGEPAAALAVCA